jgi:ATP-dependent helicase HrpB
MTQSPHLPIDDAIPQIIDAVRSARRAVVVAPPGAGKTTRVPPAILRANLLDASHPNLIMLQPRRVAARASAARIAEENGWQLGREVGYHIRFDRRIARDTRLRVMTEGILTRQLLDDATLDGIGCVVLDEFHERSIHTDLAIAMLREIRSTIREDLILIVMSATLDAEPVARFLDGATSEQVDRRRREYALPPLGKTPVIRAEGRVHPVAVSHSPASIADAVREAINSPGHILVLLPGIAEIRRAAEDLETIAQRENALLLPLHGSLTAEEQDRALRPSDRRKIILATNIAETSLTIDGVRVVIDTGLARIARFDPHRGLDRLEIQRISRASANQRAGRAGRTAPGKCIRLWPANEDRHLAEFEEPEVKRIDLTPTVLALHAWGDPRKFTWFESPESRTLDAAQRLLEMLGATTSETLGKITEIGKRLLALPVHPRIGRLLLAAADAGMAREGAAIAALLSEKDILRRSEDRAPKTQADSDLLIRLEILEEGGRGEEVDRAALRQVIRVRDELLRLSPSPGTPGEGGGEGDFELPATLAIPNHPHPNPLPGYRERGQENALMRLPLFAYPDRVCRRRGNDPSAGVMVGGGGVRLAAESVVRQHEFFLALDARQDQRNPNREAIVHIASAIEPAWLEEFFPQEIRRERVAVYDEKRDRVVGRGTVHYRDLLIREDKDAAVDVETAREVFGRIAKPQATAILARDQDAQRWLARLEMLRRAMPEHDWPVISPESIVGDARSMAELKKQLMPTLQSLLHYPLDRLFDVEAPETIQVPSGSRIRVEYCASQPPLLAVRLQEVFGWQETPRIAGGRVKILLHLLGPNFRPVQITNDLKSFWKSTYFQVRKDLRVRYPKHAWPEDPLIAKPPFGSEPQGRRQAKGGRKR